MSRKLATCHPSRRHAARGLCKPCYFKAWRLARPEKRRHDKEEWDKKNPGRLLLYNAKQRAKDEGVPFALTMADITIPEICPVLGIPLVTSTGKPGPIDSSPTLDKFIPELGYIPGNVAVISWRANRLKGDGKVEDFQKIATWMEEVLSKS
jgi:hypothetical protein